jgi:alpha-beta hydrolase superfamily lysophospholipase
MESVAPALHDTLLRLSDAAAGAAAGNGVALHTWSASPAPRGVLVAVHGIGGHGAPFRRLAEGLAAQGWAVWAPDLPGHGLSPGPRGWVPSWRALGEVVALTLGRAAAAFPGRPRVLLGHSLGGAVCLDLLLREPALAQDLQGLVLTNPALDAQGIAPWRVLAARLLARLWPTLTLDTGIDMTLASRDPAALERFRADPLRHSRCSMRLGAGFLAAAATLPQRVSELRLPLLLLQSGDDRVTGPAAAERVFAAAGSADKTWRLYPQSRHELLDDLDRAAVLADLHSWLQRHGA